jgi:hypothetical protein
VLANYNLTTNFHPISSAVAPPTTDFYGNPRPASGFNPGAVEFVAGSSGGCTVEVSPSTLAFGNQNDGTTSTQDVTIQNLCGATSATGGTFTFGGGTPQPFTRVTTGTFPAGAPNCTATLLAGASCTIKVQFLPTTSTTYSRTLTVVYGAGVTVSGSPVTLTGTGTAVATLSFTGATHGTLSTLSGVRTLTFTIPTGRAAVTSVVTLTNSGGLPLAITAETLAANMGGLFSITGTSCSFTTALAPGGTCTVSIQYATPTARPTLPNMGTLAVANNGSSATGGVTDLMLSAR